MSNEDSTQSVIPVLKQTAKPGGVYIGVGSEQNFTYIGAIEPRIAFVMDIQRGNMLEMLMYKALFELSSDRADFLSRLLSRKRPPGLDTNSTVKTLFNSYRSAAPDRGVYAENLKRVLDRLTEMHRFSLTDSDRTQLAGYLMSFFSNGPDVESLDKSNPTYSALMTATDPQGQPQSYLASEKTFAFLQDLQKKNLIVPVVGDFAGTIAIRSIADYLKQHEATVTVFYVSNVESYLFPVRNDTSGRVQGWKGFYSNLKALPIDGSSRFIRSIHNNAAQAIGASLSPNGRNWQTLLSPIGETLRAFDQGRVTAYKDVIDLSN